MIEQTDLPHDHGAGTRVTLDTIETMVNIAMPDCPMPAVVWGAVPDSPIGPKVVVGVKGQHPHLDEPPRSYLAHLTSSEAIAMAHGLMEAAAIISAHEAML